MKQKLAFLFLTCLFLTACSNNASSQNTQVILPPPTTLPASSATVSVQDVDLDLTNFSTTIVYTELFNMAVEPANYVGKTIRVQGTYQIGYDEGSQKYYHYVVVDDATACCVQGIEFVWDGTHQYPDDYPPTGTAMEIVGEFKSYAEGEFTYGYLEIAEPIIL